MKNKTILMITLIAGMILGIAIGQKMKVKVYYEDIYNKGVHDGVKQFSMLLIEKLNKDR